ncbi:MAG: endonuclease/exonuclease/phosphatase family protein [Proteobacteria bacterium]|nr:endonuclease/exonuclease/phosphatase family protein [Pseudomonadota bacterium]MBL6997211.1 endonuclease/exonuclease/phosphatase family protein [Phycisphaerales bacterium]
MTPSLLKNILAVIICLLASEIYAQNRIDLEFNFDTDGKSQNHQFNNQDIVFEDGLDGQAIVLNPDKGSTHINLDNVSLDSSKDFSIQFWIKTTSKNPTVFLSQKSFENKSITTQKNAGWVLYSSGGTFAWSIGSGSRRITYERDNEAKMPVNDGEWHQITLTYSKELSEFRLYYDGHNKAIYKANFEFSNNEPIVIGSVENTFDFENKHSLKIESGLQQLQMYVDEFNALGLDPLENEEFIDLLVDPEGLFDAKQEMQVDSYKTNKKDLAKALAVRRRLSSNPYTVYQNRNLTNLKPVSKIYALKDGKVMINDSSAKLFTLNEKLYPPEFSMDNLSIVEQTISAKEVLDSYRKYRKCEPFELASNLKDITVGVWNIWHGGMHWTLEKDGWDSRLRIVEMIKEKKIDIILMQETYSSGDFLAAELGYYFATTSDWDYCFQGANISVISRYPIQEVQVLHETEFYNVAVKLAISETQEIWAMSNWYGMNQFLTAFDFHKSRFAKADNIPVVFGGDFNAVPHTDGGNSPASKSMIEEGFTDAFRSLYPDVKKYPGFTHRNGERIDQLYYKGKGMKNDSTEVISLWPTGFPSDHYLIVSKFALDYLSPIKSKKDEYRKD